MLKSLQSCPTLCNPMDCSLPGSFVHGILQARTLEWVTMPSSRRSSWPRDQTHVSCISCIAGRFFTTEPLGKPIIYYTWVYLSESFIALPSSGGNHCYPSACQCLMLLRSSMLLLWDKGWVKGSQWYVWIYSQPLSLALPWWISCNWVTASWPHRLLQHCVIATKCNAKQNTTPHRA